MIIIEKNGGLKDVYFSLTPFLTNEYYLFELISKQTGAATIFCQINIAPSDVYFQKFEFVEGGNDPLNGGFDLEIGEFDYTVYELPFQSIDINDATAVLGKGLMKIIDPNDFKYDAEENDGFKIYE